MLFNGSTFCDLNDCLRVVSTFRDIMQAIALFIICLPFVGTHDMTNEKLSQLTSALVQAEALLENTDTGSCLNKLFCVLETEEAEDLDSPLKYAVKYLLNEYGDIDPLEFHQVTFLVRQFPHISQIVDSIHLGKLNRRSNDCDNSLPECNVEANELISATIMYNGTDVMGFSSTLARGTTTECNIARALCTALKVACTICAIFTGGTCTAVCGPALSVACLAVSAACSIG